MMLASFVAGLTGETGKVRISNLQDLGQAIDKAVAIQEILCQEKSNESFYTGTDRSVRTMTSPNDGAHKQINPWDSRSDMRSERKQNYNPRHNSRTAMTEIGHEKAAFKCFECGRIGHLRCQCPNWLKKGHQTQKPPDYRDTREWTRRTEGRTMTSNKTRNPTGSAKPGNGKEVRV
jgi:hypothetical protein